MEEQVTKSCSNIFADLGFPLEEATILHMRATLLNDVRQFVTASDMSAESVAAQLGMSRSRLADLMDGAWQQFSLESLITTETRLGRPVTLQLVA